MKKTATLAFMLFSIIAAAQSEINMSGSLEFLLDQTREMDGNDVYSMNGDVFSKWKKSTNDNTNDNRDKFQAILNLNSEIKVNDNVKVNVGFETMYDELIGRANGSGATAGEEFATVRDNAPLILKDITAEIDSDMAKFIITNNFNYDFNKRVLTTQLDADWGEGTPYGEGILAEKDIMGVKTKAFLFQSSSQAILEHKYSDGEAPLLPSGGDINLQDDILQADAKMAKMIYGIDLKKDFSKGQLGVLAINEHEKSSEIKGDNFKKDLDIGRVAVNGQLDLTRKLSLKGEFITARYGKDVTTLTNTWGERSWDKNSFDVSGVDGKKDSSIIDFSTNYNFSDNLKISLGYKDVGEDYYAVLGNSHKQDSWLGDLSFKYDDGTGYDKGISAKIDYTLGKKFPIKTSLEATKYDLTRSAFNDAKDDNEQEIKAMAQVGKGKWKAETSLRQILTKNGSAKDEATDIVNAKGEMVLYSKGNLNAKVIGDVNLYAGEDYVLKKTYSEETRVKIGANVSYKATDKVSLSGAYNFGHSIDKNDIIKETTATQNMLNLGMKYQITGDVALNVGYKYDKYQFDDKGASIADIQNSRNRKMEKYQIYDGAEPWANSIKDYKGYETHQLTANVVVRF